MGPPPEKAVGLAPAQADTWETTVSAVGSISSLRNVAVSAEVPGDGQQDPLPVGRHGERGPGAGRAGIGGSRARRRRRGGARRDASKELASRDLDRSRMLARGGVVPQARSSTRPRPRFARAANTDLAALTRAGRPEGGARAVQGGKLGIRAVNVGQYLAPGTTVTTRRSDGAPLVDFAVPQEELAVAGVGLPIRVTIEGAIRTPLTGRRSARSSHGRPRTRNVKVRATIPEARHTAPGMFVNVDVIRPGNGGGRGAGDGDRARAVRRLGVRDRGQEAGLARHGQDARRQAGADRAPAVRAARRRRAATSSRSPRAQAGQEVVSAGAFKLRNGVAGRGRQPGASRRPSSILTPRTAEAHEVHRRLRAPAGARDRGEPRDPRRRLAGDPLAQRAAVPQLESATVTVHDRLRRRQRRARARLHHHAARARRSPRPTASTTSSRRACRDCRRSTCGSSSTSTPPNALADISARVNQVRADLPPEAEMPAIKIEPSDAQIAAMYLSFGSNILEDNQVTDYLIRVVQPRLSAIAGVQRADILGGRTFALRAWLKPDRMAASTSARPRCGGAGRQQLPRRGRADQGRPGPGQHHRDHRSRARSTSSAARHPRTERHAGASAGRGRRRARCRGLRSGRALLRAEGRVHGRLGAAERELARGDRRGRAEMERSRPSCRPACRPTSRSTRPQYIDRRDRGGAQDAERDDADRDRRHLPVPRLATLGAGADRRHSGVADRRACSSCRRSGSRSIC